MAIWILWCVESQGSKDSKLEVDALFTKHKKYQISKTRAPQGGCVA